jgi:hypothetical protein
VDPRATRLKRSLIEELSRLQYVCQIKSGAAEDALRRRSGSRGLRAMN